MLSETIKDGAADPSHTPAAEMLLKPSRAAATVSVKVSSATPGRVSESRRNIFSGDFPRPAMRPPQRRARVQFSLRLCLLVFALCCNY
ncbi:unnamed protein product [Cyprideis torosa]|uniref:Uncharacterized protein n=1 Tax=Cyprideis torosa TaxID=163714 RepID=A0A7R8WL80_9CRUS|nr:unnamed protein product [Cyprideis torosa]CAG0901293.1 unnamed protein product [Cyprideis torosa]